MKNILITGGSRGIGKEILTELKNNNFNCIAPTRKELDIDDPNSIKSFFDGLDVTFYGLVNNAGINILSNIEAITDDDIEAMFSVNLAAPLKLIQYVVENMKLQGEGKIVNLSSIWGVRSKQYRTLYSMTKFGINGMTKSLARELGKHNILINSVAPGYVNTEMTQKNIPIEEQNSIRNSIPLQRFAEPQEIAKLVSFLISNQNSYITGQTIIIDGGFLS